MTPTEAQVKPAMQEAVKALSLEMDKPNLVALSYALRHPETWPKDFEWDYGTCATCAIGLVMRLWPKESHPNPNEVSIITMKTWIAREMAMSYKAAQDTFFHLPRTVDSNCDGITPDDVAESIDQYLASA